MGAGWSAQSGGGVPRVAEPLIANRAIDAFATSGNRVPRGGALAPARQGMLNQGLAEAAGRRDMTPRTGRAWRIDARSLLVTGRRLLLAGAAGFLAGPALAQGFTPAQRAEIVDIIRRALREDPSILREAFEAAQEAEERDRATTQRAAILANRDAIFNDPADASKGNPRADVVIAEFFDLRCPYCKRLHGDMDAFLRRDRNVRVVLKDIPILGPASVTASRALLAAQRQGKYVEYYDALMRVRGDLTEAVLRTEAERIGLDFARIRRDMEDGAIQQRIDANLRLARTLRIDGTPALVIGETLIPGAVDQRALERAVADQRQAQRRG